MQYAEQHLSGSAFLAVACVLHDLVTFDRMRLMRPVLAVDDELLKRELPRLFLRCLGVNEAKPR